MGCAVSSKYKQLYCTMNQEIFTESEIKSSEFNQLFKVNTMLKYILAHRILLIILIFNKDCAVATIFYLMNQILTLASSSFYRCRNRHMSHLHVYICKYH